MEKYSEDIFELSGKRMFFVCLFVCFLNNKDKTNKPLFFKGSLYEKIVCYNHFLKVKSNLFAHS